MINFISKARKSGGKKGVEPNETPQELFDRLAQETGGHIGGTIRDGSDSEKFALGSLCFNIQAARRIAGDKANGTAVVSEAWSKDIAVSPSHALRGNSENPVFIAMIPTEDGFKNLLIDGHHRMYRAIRDKEKTLPAFIFTPEEALTFLEAPPDIMSQIEASLRALNGGVVAAVAKNEPTASSVHVPSPDWTIRLAKEAVWMSHDPENLKRLKDSFDTFITEEGTEKMRKDQPPRVLEGGGLTGANQTNAMEGIYDMAEIVNGMDWELGDGGLADSDDAKERALENLSNDPDYYRKKRLELENSPERTAKDTQENEDDPAENVGLNLDLGSGQARENGYLGIDLYPFDHGTIVHDLELGLPFLEDETCSKIRMSNVPEVDPKILMSEIQRVLMPGGQFVYEGPSEVYNYPPYMEEMQKEQIDKTETTPSWTKQKFRRMSMPDAATSNDAEPRVGINQWDMLPADALLAMDAASYDAADATSTGRGNRLHGYPSQGALVGKRKIPGVEDLGTDNTGAISKSRFCPIYKADQYKQIVYCVVLSPNETDLQDDIMTAADIEETAHDYLLEARVVGSGHSKPIDAGVAESYIVPQEFEINGQFGPQTVKKGAWVIAIKINDKKEWAKVLSGEYTGVSVGGFGARTPV